MKSIAFITKGFTGSIIPLAKNIADKGFKVDIYLFNYICIDDLEAFDCHYKSAQFGVDEINVQNWKSTNGYFGAKKQIRIFSLKMPRPYSSIPVLSSIMKLYGHPYVLNSCKFINSQRYSFVNFVCGYYSSEYLPFLKRIDAKVIVSLHEVCDHFYPKFSKPSKLLKYLFKNNIDCIIYSDNSLRKILKYEDVKKEKLYRVNFGLFDSFKSFQIKKSLCLPSTYALFFGSIVKYKGLDVLYKAICRTNRDIHFVIAGKGNDPSLIKLSKMDNVTIINRRLTNSELCELIFHSSFIICPYLTMSQSGIPQTVFSFGKPIIVSDLDGFKEIVTSGENGLIFKCGNSENLAKCINKLFSEPLIRHNMEANIDNFEKLHKEYSWDRIADYYLSHFIK